MKIGIAATRLAGVDGVTFETAKWEAVLDRMGHELRLCAGEVDALRYQARLVPPMHFAWPPAERVTAAAFDPDSNPDAVLAEIKRSRTSFSQCSTTGPGSTRSTRSSSRTPGPSRCSCRSGSPCAGWSRSGLPAIGHHHDYWWERERFATCVVPEVLEEAFPAICRGCATSASTAPPRPSWSAVVGSSRSSYRTSSTSAPAGRESIPPCDATYAESSAWATAACSSFSRRESCRARN